ncbi:MAG: glycosyltransferase [Actinophytocola sp.]|uniref:glycosyltransferase n=1 Tax=Actinophytocola sp. TaxID=1872138 RepID=UPI003C76D4AB
MPSISVLMPCYDAGRYLRASVDSAVGQLGPDDELVVQDACSTDGSSELLDEIAAADHRVSVRHERDDGQSDALNRALRRARGDLVCWLNADDLLLPGALAAVRAEVLAGGRTPELVVGGWQLLSANGLVLRENPAERLDHRTVLRRGCYVFSGALLVRRDVLVAGGGYAADLHYVMDFDLMLRLAARRDQLLVRHPLAALRYHRDSKSGDEVGRFFTEALGVRWRGVRHPADVPSAAVGSVVHGMAVATMGLRFGAVYSRLRRKAMTR